MSNTDRYLNEAALESLVRSAFDNAKFNQSGELHFPAEITDEISDLPVDQAIHVLGQVKHLLYQHSAEIAFQMNLQGMGIYKASCDNLQPVAADWAHRRVKERKAERTNQIFNSWGWPIFCAACFIAGVAFYLHNNGQQIQFDRNSAIEAKR